MSNVDADVLKSPESENIPFLTRTEDFTTAQLRHDCLLEFSKLLKTTKIVNNDGVNILTYRLQSPSATLRTVPPNSEDTLNEWTSYLEINPNPVTGSGVVEMDLVTPIEAVKNG